jgi:hypothetical protein
VTPPEKPKCHFLRWRWSHHGHRHGHHSHGKWDDDRRGDRDEVRSSRHDDDDRDGKDDHGWKDRDHDRRKVLVTWKHCKIDGRSYWKRVWRWVPIEWLAWSHRGGSSPSR